MSPPAWRGSGIDLGAEAARLCRAAAFTAVPRLLDEGADPAGSWIVTSALPGQMAAAFELLADTWHFRGPGPHPLLPPAV